METEGFLTVQQAAQRLGVTDNCIRIATKEGRLPARYVFGRKVIRAVDLEAYRLRTRPDNQKPTGRPKGSKKQPKQLDLFPSEKDKQNAA